MGGKCVVGIVNGLQEDVNLAMDEPAPRSHCACSLKLRHCRSHNLWVGPVYKVSCFVPGVVADAVGCRYLPPAVNGTCVVIEVEVQDEEIGVAGLSLRALILQEKMI